MRHLRLDQRLFVRPSFPISRREAMVPLPVPDQSLWLKMLWAALRAFRTGLFVVMRLRKRKLILVERALSGWGVSQNGQKTVVHLRSHMAATNPSNDEGFVVVRVQIDRRRFLRRGISQECHFCDVAGTRVSPLSPGALIPARTTTMMQISHPFETTKPPSSETLAFRVIATDQFNRRHTKRIRLQKFGS
jgi:hypothetical protein